MIKSFKDDGTEAVFYGRNTKKSRKVCPFNLLSVAVRKLDQLDSAEHLNDLYIPPGNRLEALKGNWSSYFSIRINEQYRICFKWLDGGPDYVEIVDYHK